ncbi:MAG: hypothetical protein V4643_12445 [Bacteroidota bacterium]
MRIIVIIFFALVITSCSKQKVIKYEKNGVIITRVDKDADTYFYYGNYDESYPASHIRAEYHGFDGIMHAYIVFHPNEKVEILRLDGVFYDDKMGANQNLYLTDHSKIDLDSFQSEIKVKCDNVIEITDGINDNFKTEKLLNERIHSQVKVIYP